MTCRWNRFMIQSKTLPSRAPTILLLKLYFQQCRKTIIVSKCNYDAKSVSKCCDVVGKFIQENISVTKGLVKLQNFVSVGTIADIRLEAGIIVLEQKYEESSAKNPVQSSVLLGFKSNIQCLRRISQNIPCFRIWQ